MSETGGGTVERFAARARDHGAEVTRVPAAEATDEIAALVEPPAVGTALPFEDVSLPGDVGTDPTPAELDAATTGVTAAQLGVADYGSIALEPTPEGSEPVSLFPDLHVAVVREDTIVPDVASALSWFADQDRTSAILATGPSATADMGELVLGAHGPRDVHVVVIR